MESVSFIEIDSFGQTQTYAIIDRGNGEYASMLKSTWDELQAQQSHYETALEGQHGHN